MKKRLSKKKIKTENDVYLDVIKFLIKNSKRYNEKNLYVNVIDALLTEINDVECCEGCSHNKGLRDGTLCCDMLPGPICREGLIERAKKGVLK